MHTSRHKYIQVDIICIHMFIVKLFFTEKKSENDMFPLGDNGINKFIYRIYIILQLTIDSLTNINMNTFQKRVTVNIRSYI